MRWAWAVLWLGCACAGKSDPAAPSVARAPASRPATDPVSRERRPTSPSPARAAPAQAPLHRQPARVLPRLRVAERSGESATRALDGCGQWFSTGAHGRLAVDLAPGTRIRLEPNTQAFVPAFEPAGVVVVSGALWAQMQAQPGRAGVAPLRLVIAGASLVADGVCELLVAQRARAPSSVERRTFVALLRGAVQRMTLVSGSTEAVTQRARRIEADQPVFASSAGATRFARARDLAQARALVAGFFRHSGQGQPVRQAEADARLQAALDAFAQQAAVGKALLARARAERSAPDREPGSARAALGALVTHAQRKHMLRQTLLTAAEQSLLAALTACRPLSASDHPEPGAECAELHAWRARFGAGLQAAR